MARGNRDKLLDTAERLFAKRGCEAVSLREINTAAGVSQGVLHYQFGGRDGLIEALLARRFPALHARRQVLLEALRQGSDPPGVEELVKVIIYPLAELVLERGRLGQRFLRLLAHLSMERSPQLQRYLAAQQGEFTREVIDLLEQALPRHSREDVVDRLLMMSFSMYRALADLREPHWLWDGGGTAPTARARSPEERIEVLLDFYSAGIRGNLNAATAGAPSNQPAY